MPATALLALAILQAKATTIPVHAGKDAASAADELAGTNPAKEGDVEGAEATDLAGTDAHVPAAAASGEESSDQAAADADAEAAAEGEGASGGDWTEVDGKIEDEPQA